MPFERVKEELLLLEPPCVAAADRSCLQRGFASHSKLWVNTSCFGSKVLRVASGFSMAQTEYPEGGCGREQSEVAGSFLVLAMARHQPGVPLMALVQHCRPAAHPWVHGWAHPWAGFGLWGHPQGWELVGSTGTGSLEQPSLLPAQCLTIQCRAGTVHGNTSPAPCLSFPTSAVR